MEFLKFNNPKKTMINNFRAFSQKNLNQIMNDSPFEEKIPRNFILIEKDKDEEMKILNYFFDKAIEYKKKNYSIFCNLLSILVNTRLVEYFEESKIDKIKSIIIKELKNKDEKNSDIKKTIFISCFQILISYYFINDKFKEKKIRNQQNFHLFIRNLNINLDFFYSLILSLKQIKDLSSNFTDNIDINQIEKNIKNEKNSEEKDKSFLNAPPLFEKSEIDNLNEIQANTIKSILEDIVYILYRMELNNEKKEFKFNDSFNSNQSIELNLEKEMFDILFKNIALIFEWTDTKIYQEIFSSETEICAELFYLKWIYNETGDNIENKIMKYHEKLLKNHTNPFIFKFYLFVSNQNIFQIGHVENDEERIKKTKLEIFKFIVNTLYEFQKKLDIKNDNYKYYIYNLINYLIILNEELENNSNIFKISSFYEIFYKYVRLLDNSCLLFSNYYIELEEKCGKIISEIIYDLFFAIFDFSFNEKEFIKAFTKECQKDKEIYSIFYLIDIAKDKNLDKEPKIKEEIKKFIPNIDNFKNIHKNYFNKKIKYKLFLDKKLQKIEEVNLSIYFLAKSFIYLKTKPISEKFNKLLKQKYLPLLSQNIYRLYTKRNVFYKNKICAKFPLYSLTKKFIETYIIPNPSNFKLYDEFFFTDISVTLKEESFISYCYSSRLINDFKRKVINPNRRTTIKIDKDLINKNEIPNEQLNFDPENMNDMANPLARERNIRPMTNKDLTFSQINSTYFPRNFTFTSGELGSSKFWDISKMSEKEEKEEKDEKEQKYFNSFELIKKGNNIFNPKNYFFKLTFAEIYKNLIFEDKLFKAIRSTYLTKFRHLNNVNQDTKQTNFPMTQKNFSNSLEPKIFMRRDFNFYDEKIFKISHSYIKTDINNNLENIYFYPHKCKIKEEKESLKSLYCELVTRQYILFGKMHFLDNFLYFESEKEDPRDHNQDLETFMKFFISNRISENNDIISKQKSILIFNEDIYEIIQRRTLLANQSIEIFHKNGKSYFFNFFRSDNVKKAYNYFNEINKKLIKEKLPPFIFNTTNNVEDIKNICSLFRKGKSSNYEYLLYLNKYATRTYNDLSQYPVFPWLVKDYKKIPEIFEKLKDKEQNEYSDYFRDMKYPISMQTEEKREDAANKFLSEAKNLNFPSHLGTHYSTEAYILYYLMRINPYGTNLIRLQNYKLEDANRMFNNFTEIKEILKNNNDNREIIPDFFCYFDYFCNLNCCFYGYRTNKVVSEVIDDFALNNNLSSHNNNISSYVKSIFNNKKLLNNTYVSSILYDWVDIIFGRKQIPKREEDIPECCNIYNKLAYEQKVNFEKKIEKNYELYKNQKITEKRLKIKIQGKISFVLNFGMNAKQILEDTIKYDGSNKTFEPFYKSSKSNEDKYFYFNKINNDNYIALKDYKKNKIKTRVAIICDKNFKEKDNYIYDCKSMNLMKYKNGTKSQKDKNIQLYKIEYAFSYLFLYFDKSALSIFLSCRYLENYFRIQYHQKIINIYYEDFVTCIKARNLTEKGDDIFYTGLIDGKLTEWKLIPYLNNNKKSKSKYNFTVKELKNIYAHKSSITAIEIYQKQNIIITSGEDKFIYIRKIFDFELLTVIDLTYSFGNPIISKTYNIFPSLIKISELNLLYVLLYDYNSKKTFIRGYNLNGLFFAQTDLTYFKDKKIYFQFNNISFTKNANLIVGFNNLNKFFVLDASNLQVLWVKEIKRDEDKSQKSGNKMLEYNYNSGEFYILYDEEYNIMTLEKNEMKLFDTY